MVRLEVVVVTLFKFFIKLLSCGTPCVFSNKGCVSPLLTLLLRYHRRLVRVVADSWQLIFFERFKIFVTTVD